MIRMTNKTDQATKVIYIEKPVIVEKQIPTDAIIQYVDREVVREIPVSGETVVIQKEVDLQPLHDKDVELDVKLNKLGEIHNNFVQSVISELEMQRRALISIKLQRDVDRKRRLTLIKKLRKQRDANMRTNKIVYITLAASFLLSIITLIK